jgi:hypothetical protein
MNAVHAKNSDAAAAKMNFKIRSGVKALPLMMDSFLLLSSLRRKKAFSTSPS